VQGIFSRVLEDPKLITQTIERELLAIVVSLEEFGTAINNAEERVWIATDHANLDKGSQYKATRYRHYK
jgi:RNase H-like domain found in reverse transcriptase